MRILLTNDDGIDAPGIQALKETLAENFTISLIAPREERSAAGHSITVHHPLRAEERGEKEWAVDGTPADCVKLGIYCLMERPPHLVISGINRGANLGTDVFYSGTVSAAMEGAIMGYPALAFSLVRGEDWDFSFGAAFARDFIYFLKQEKFFSSSLLLNINFPAVKKEEIRGIAYTRLGKTMYKDVFHQRRDPKDRPYFWMAGQPVLQENTDITDVSMIEKGYITVTPLHMDLTDHVFLEKMKAQNPQIGNN